MTEQDDALRLADLIEKYRSVHCKGAAAELRRLHEVNAQLLEALENLERTAGQPATRNEPVRVKARAAIAAAKGGT